MTHTPTPWTVSENDATKIYGNRNDQPYSYMVADTYGYKDEREANAAFIVRCCNSHDQLVEALEAIADGRLGKHCTMMSIGQLQEVAKAALAKARGEA